MHSLPRFCLLCCSFVLLFVSSSLQQQSSGGGDDFRALLEFKKGIQEDLSGNVLTTWIATGSSSGFGGGCPSLFYGVSCDGNGAVLSVSLDGLGLSGEIKFSTLIGMKSLQSLSISNNNLTGRLVPALGSISSLQHLDLSRNQFYGRIPGRMTELWSMSYLNISFNNFDGVFPDGIGRMQQLRQLDVRSNGLWGDVGSMLSEMRNVEYLDLSGNAFFGNLWMPSENLSNLGNTAKYMNFSSNKLSGGFFSTDAMRVFRNLEVLDASDNVLTGELPKLDSVTNLKIFMASNNLLKGSVPQELFGSSMPLKELDLSRNRLTGSIFSINSTSLRVLNLSSNELSGNLPSSMGSCLQVDLRANRLSGDLSAMQNWGSLLEVLDLSSNDLSGRYPPNLTSQFSSLLSIRISNNSLEGAFSFETHPRISTIDLSLNRLNGLVPPSLFTSLNLTNVNLSGNHFTGPIPILIPHSTESLVLSNYPHMEYLDLSANSLSGPLPPDIVSFQSLKLLNLQHNSLYGHIPNEIGELESLKYLDLSSNHFDGKIPDISLSSLEVFNISFNDLVGVVPKSLRKFPDSSFHPGNTLLIYPDVSPEITESSDPVVIGTAAQHHHFKSRIRLAIIVGCIGAVILIFFIFMAVYRIRTQELCGRNSFEGQNTRREMSFGKFSLNFFQSHKKDQSPAPMNCSNDHLLNSCDTNVPARKELVTAQEHSFSNQSVGIAVAESIKSSMPDNCIPQSRFKSSPGSPLTSLHEQPAVLNVYSPDRLVGELFFLDTSLVFTAEDLSRAPAEVLGRSNHGTSYKATLDNGRMLTVKWLRVGLVKRKKEFAKEMKKIGTIRHTNIISFRAYYWGPREQERLLVSDYVNGDSLALHLYESTPRRYSRLTFPQRLRITIDVARCLSYLHQEKGLPHGNLKPTNILLAGPELTAQLSDYGLHHLMTLSGIAEQMLNLGAVGYRAPELANAAKPLPSFKADVYAFGVIIMELLTRRSAGDIISGQSGAVDLTDWVRMCAREGRGSECFDRDIAGLEEAPRAMDELLAVSLNCILPVNERPSIATILEDLCSISI